MTAEAIQDSMCWMASFQSSAPLDLSNSREKGNIWGQFLMQKSQEQKQ